MHDTTIYEKYFCKATLTPKDVADYIVQWLPDLRKSHASSVQTSQLGKEWGGIARKDLSDTVASNKSVTAKLYANEPLSSDDIREILIYLESAQKAMHQLMPEDKVAGLDNYIAELASKAGKPPRPN
jgi:hypothetical protein